MITMTAATMTDDEAKTSADTITYRYTDYSLDFFTLIFVIEHDDDYKDDDDDDVPLAIWAQIIGRTAIARRWRFSA